MASDNDKSKTPPTPALPLGDALQEDALTTVSHLLEHASSGDHTGRIQVFPGDQVQQAPQKQSAPRLVVLIGDEPGRKIELEGAVLLGRSDDCDVRLDDAKVSRRHARIDHTRAHEWVIEDLGSRNGTLVNGQSIDKAVLQVGDRIQLSHETLLLFTRQDPLEDLLLHRQQMEVIGQLAAGIAHDFNNLLNVVLASTVHLTELSPDTQLGSTEVRECHTDIRAAASRAAELTARLLGIARRRNERQERFQGVDVTQLCDDVLSLVRRTFDRSIKIDSEIQPDLAVAGEYASLHQLLMNLCINARDAMPEGGTLGLGAHFELEPKITQGSPWSPGPQIVIAIRDTGTGMDEETKARVFEPFFTTKEHGAGSGLGLATVYEVATSHGGYVDVTSEVGKGSSFIVRLPARVLRNRDIPAPRQGGRIRTWDGGVERSVKTNVLVVDDQELVRRSLGRLVKAAGHKVAFASDGQEALDVYFASDPRPNVVLLDLDMPNMAGDECLLRLQEKDPGVRVVLVSGYYDEARRRRLLAQGACDFLPKPVDAEQLRQSIQTAVQTT